MCVDLCLDDIYTSSRYGSPSRFYTSSWPVPVMPSFPVRTWENNYYYQPYRFQARPGLGSIFRPGPSYFGSGCGTRMSLAGYPVRRWY